MNRKKALKKLKYYKDTLNFPNETVVNMSFIEKYKMKRLIKKALPICTKDGCRYKWKITFNIKKIYDIYSEKLIYKTCTNISPQSGRYFYNIQEGEIRYYENYSSIITWKLEDALKEFEIK